MLVLPETYPAYFLDGFFSFPYFALWVDQYFLWSGGAYSAVLCSVVPEPQICSPMDCSPPDSSGFSRQEYWSGLPFPPSGDLPDSEIKPVSLTSPALAGGFFTTSAAWEAHCWEHHHCFLTWRWILPLCQISRFLCSFSLLDQRKGI